MQRGLSLSLLIVFAAAPAVAVTPQQFLDAMDIPAGSTIVSSQGNADQFGALASLGPLAPTVAPEMGMLSTGLTAGFPTCNDQDWSQFGCSAVCDPVEVVVDLLVPPLMNSLTFDFQFMSREFPEWVQQGYNDTFTVQLVSQAFTGDIVFDYQGNPINVDSVLMAVGCCDSGTGCNYSVAQCPLLGTGSVCTNPFQDGGGTGWLTTRAPVVPGETIRLTFEIHDEGDGSFDSAVVLDGFSWSDREIDEPTTAPEIRLDWLSPKTGPLAGGQVIELHGNNFLPSGLAVRFGDQLIGPGLVTWRSSTVIEVYTPSRALAETVDIMVSNGIDDSRLIAGYTFEDPGVLPAALPVLTSIEPYSFAFEGDMPTVVLTGVGFEPGITVQWGDRLISATAVSFDTERRVEVTPPSAEELGFLDPQVVDVTVINPGGLRSEARFPVVYDSDRPAPSDGGEQDSGCGASIAGQSPVSLALLLVLAGLLLRLRRSRHVGPVLASVVPLLLVGCTDVGLTIKRGKAIAVVPHVTYVLEGGSVELNGGSSYSFDVTDTQRGPESIAQYQWELLEAPGGANAVLVPTDESGATVAMNTPVEGVYRAGLTVTSELGDVSTNLAVSTVYVLPWKDLSVTLNWTTPGVDLDLHLLRNGGAYWDAENDCHFANQNPDWGLNVRAEDNPVFGNDIADGNGAETIVLPTPVDGPYRAIVHYYHDHGSNSAVNGVEITVGVAGTELGTWGPISLNAMGDAWIAVDLDPAQSRLATVDELTSHSALGGPPYAEHPPEL